MIELVKTLVLAAIIFVVVQTFVLQTFQVQQRSMQPTLEPGQYLLVDKLTPRFDDYSRGDIIVFRPTGFLPTDTPYIKRVIGVPGDTVELQNGRVIVNGQPLEEPYLPEGEPTTPQSGETSWTVPEGELFVLGDHRTASQDSRSSFVGLADLDNVVGRAWLSFWPFDTFGIIQTPRYDVPDAVSTPR